MAFNKSWNDEDPWWRNNYSSRPYATGRNYEDFRPAYQYGFESGRHHLGRTWTDVESDLETGLGQVRGPRQEHLGEHQACRSGCLASGHRPERPRREPDE